MIVNGLAILNNERFLEKCELSKTVCHQRRPLCQPGPHISHMLQVGGASHRCILVLVVDRAQVPSSSR